MLYSIGYQKLQAGFELAAVLTEHGIDNLLDVRSRPYGRKHEFNKKNLEAMLSLAGIAYFWCGKTLGGFSQISESAIAGLAKWQADKTACLMCMEADPDRCHRKYDIAKRLSAYGVTVNHIKS